MNSPSTTYRRLLHRAKACAYCAHLTTVKGPRCGLDDEAISLEEGTCGAWVLDSDLVFEYASSHEKAAALVLKQATYHVLPQLPEVPLASLPDPC